MNQQQLAAVRHMVEALEQATPHLPAHTDWHFEAIAAGKALLEQQEPVQDPVNHIKVWPNGDSEGFSFFTTPMISEPVYTTPPAQHTPGPWVSDGVLVFANDDCDLHPVADCTTNHTCRTEDEAEANARLIAAAPDLLEALTRLLTDEDYAEAERNARAVEARLREKKGGV